MATSAPISEFVPLPCRPCHMGRTFRLQRLGRYDPTARYVSETFTKVFFDGERVVRICVRCDGRGTLWASGPDDVLVAWAQQMGDDGYDGFCPQHLGLRQLRHRVPGLRLMPMPWMFDVLCGAVLQQRVRFSEAARQFRLIASRWGHATPEGLTAFPHPATLASVSMAHLASLGVDGKRAKTLLGLAHAEAKRPVFRLASSRKDLRTRLATLPGIGPWTSEMLMLFAAGDADAVPLGDVHLPHTVSWFFYRRVRSDDETMLQTLAPFAGQRGRVLRMISEVQPKKMPLR